MEFDDEGWIATEQQALDADEMPQFRGRDLLPPMTELGYDFYSVDDLIDLENNPSIMLLPKIRCEQCGKPTGHLHDAYFAHIRNGRNPKEFFTKHRLTRPCCRNTVAHPEVHHTGASYYDIDMISGKKSFDTRSDWRAPQPISMMEEIDNPFAEFETGPQIIQSEDPKTTGLGLGQLSQGTVLQQQTLQLPGLGKQTKAKATGGGLDLLQLPTTQTPVQKSPLDAFTQLNFVNPIDRLTKQVSDIDLSALAPPKPVEGGQVVQSAIPDDIRKNIEMQIMQTESVGGGLVLKDGQSSFDPKLTGDIAFGQVYENRYYTGKTKDVGMGYSVPVLSGVYKAV